ncbi:MAG: ribonuclease D, partial [Pseudomonadota bacterium]|nr:ribonuclease D [Pseudomonadota bacterium]
ASSADIEQIAAFGDKANVPAMRGWRCQVFGRDALKLRTGDLALAVDDKHMIAVDWEPCK